MPPVACLWRRLQRHCVECTPRRALSAPTADFASSRRFGPEGRTHVETRCGCGLPAQTSIRRENEPLGPPRSGIVVDVAPAGRVVVVVAALFFVVVLRPPILGWQCPRPACG